MWGGRRRWSTRSVLYIQLQGKTDVVTGFRWHKSKWTEEKKQLFVVAHRERRRGKLSRCCGRPSRWCPSRRMARRSRWSPSAPRWSWASRWPCQLVCTRPERRKRRTQRSAVAGVTCFCTKPVQETTEPAARVPKDDLPRPSSLKQESKSEFS